MRATTLMLLFGFLVSLPAWSDEAADEEAYWVYVKDNDIDGYLTL